MAQVIYSAYRNGARYDCWNEHFNWDIWEKAFEEHGIDFRLNQRKRDFEDPLPWDVIDMGIVKGYFRKERKRADQLATIPDCKWGECSHCGIPGNGEDIKLAKGSQSNPVEQPVPLKVKEQLEQVWTYRLRYSKTNWARYLSHLDAKSLFEMAFRRTGLNFKYSKGYTPRLKFHWDKHCL